MSNRKSSADENEKKQQQGLPSSHGDNSKSVTPKDVSSQDAASRDVTERKTCSSNQEEKEEEMLDDAVDSTFPASDPIAIPVDRELEKRRAHRQQP